MAKPLVLIAGVPRGLGRPFGKLQEEGVETPSQVDTEFRILGFLTSILHMVRISSEL